jgi:hypothetical protein
MRLGQTITSKPAGFDLLISGFKAQLSKGTAPFKWEGGLIFLILATATNIVTVSLPIPLH